jgi:L-cysteate sulfo-lyase
MPTRWTSPLPRFALLDGPSPLHHLPRFSAAVRRLANERGHGGPDAIWMKREDLLPLAFGGNKVRNLEFLIGDALARGADTIITSGRRWSNHCRLTAAAAARAGLRAELVLSGPPPAEPGPNQIVDVLLGARIHFTPTASRDERAVLVERLAGELAAAGRRPYVIEVGGSGAVGATGQVEAGVELSSQLDALGLRAAIVVVPTATGGTQAGIVLGLAVAGSTARVVGFAVSAPVDDARAAVERNLDALRSHVDAGLATAPAIEIDGSQLGRGGYGRRTDAAAAAAALLGRTEAILVDPIYTAKALAGLIAYAVDGSLDGSIVVFWHAGGTLGLFEPPDADEATERA